MFIFKLAEITIFERNVKPNETMGLYNDWCITSRLTFSEDNSYGNAINIFKNIRQIEFKFHNGPSIYTQSPIKIFVGILILNFINHPFIPNLKIKYLLVF